ncbi:MAG TPA: hypothetical protein PLQ13_02590 [Candidatus Krumholzibacteria bacterium]|nr:hypothetical protein [Candidatus Krumholzibacteria bacterium]
MSRNDQNEWTDSLDFESLADEQESIAPEAAADAPAEAPAAAAPAEAPAPSRRTPRKRQRPRVSGGGLGVLFAASTIVAAIGLAGAVVTAAGLDPVGLWQPQGLLDTTRLVDFQAHPLNLVYVVAFGTVLLALLGAASIARAVGAASRAAAADAVLVDKLTALRIDDEKGWQDPLFKQHATAAAFVNENVGAWRLNEARQRRATGLEGELQRLVRAAGAGNRAGLADRFDNPNVGSVADELVRYHDEREAAQQEAAAIRAKDREEAERLLNLIVEACGWSNAAMDKMGVQGRQFEQVAAAVRRLADQGSRGADDPVARSAAALASLRSHLTSLKPAPASGAADLDKLVDRANKLAFQIAMEVSRLGPRGERLLPMTQALEELATEFRSVGAGVGRPEASDEAFAAADHTLGNVQHALEQAAAATAEWRRAANETAPVAATVAAQLAALTTGFNGQIERLNNAGEACARMTGLTFDPATVKAVDPVEAPQLDLGLSRFDPFGSQAADPAPSSILGAAPEFDPFATGEAPAADAGGGFADPDPFLAEAEEPVYDLGGFGAVSLDAAAEAAPAIPAFDVTPAFDQGFAADAPAAAPARAGAPDEPQDDVLDLASFGAVRLDHNEPALALQPAGVDEDIHDLAEFGAVRLD